MPVTYKLLPESELVRQGTRLHRLKLRDMLSAGRYTKSASAYLRNMAFNRKSQKGYVSVDMMPLTEKDYKKGGL